MDVITNSDRTSPTWGKIQRLCQTRILEAQQQLESALPIESTNIVRGRIIAWRELERLDRDEPIVP